MNNSLDVMCLREHIKCSDRVKAVATREQLFEVARERRRVAGDIGDVAGAYGEDTVDRPGLGACARGIEEQEIDGRESGMIDREPLCDCRNFKGRVPQT